MELFDKYYNCYFQVVRRILEQAGQSPVTRRAMETVCREHGFLESSLTIVPKLLEGQWPLLRPAGEAGSGPGGPPTGSREPASGLGKSVSGGLPAQGGPSPAFTSALSHRFSPGEMKPPLTFLQKSWLRSLLEDRRIRLFLTDGELGQLEDDLSGAEPLYSEKDFHYFDRFRDGDDYDSLEYREHFHTILQALSQRSALIFAYTGKKRTSSVFEAVPCQLQYSSKDDKFRLCCLKLSRGHFCRHTILNLAKIEACHLSRTPVPEDLALPRFKPVSPAREPVLLEIRPQRNGLERCMLHFANYEKRTEYDEAHGVWLCSIYYDSADETELLIDILSFGPTVKVLGPQPFLDQIRQRIRRQHHLLCDPLTSPEALLPRSFADSFLYRLK